MNKYKDLKICQKSVDLAVKVYEVTKLFPKEELYGITYQLKKSAVSIPSNIAEGSGRNTTLGKEIDEIQRMNWALKKSLNLA